VESKKPQTDSRYRESPRRKPAQYPLEIDTEEITAQLEGVNVLANRISGSNWIFLSPGDNAMLLIGENFDFAHQDKAQLEVQYYNTRM